MFEEAFKQNITKCRFVSLKVRKKGHSSLTIGQAEVLRVNIMKTLTKDSVYGCGGVPLDKWTLSCDEGHQILLSHLRNPVLHLYLRTNDSSQRRQMFHRRRGKAMDEPPSSQMGQSAVEDA